ncbi:MAG TPA: YajQ family cyclic di-GMP-binding protein [Actinomycetota bacterium]|nr:YajQ family cyclic di-GMP-binding protein [Actinomycetota bacterium]
MAQSSFDVVSEIDAQEVRNALDQARREIGTRFDFKNTGTDITHDGDLAIEIHANSEGRVQAAAEVLKDKMVRRDVSLKALQEGKIEPAAGSTYKQKITLVKGIDEDKARAMNKFIKGLPVKVQSQVQGDSLRVTAKSRDDLQAVIKALKGEDFGIPLQFTNYR